MMLGLLDRIDTRLDRVPAAWFKGGLLVLYALVVALTMSRHEMWRDEIQAWLIARDSHGIADLVWNRRYEGHPLLWHLILLPVSALGRDPRLMQVAAWVISVAAMAVLILRGPFRRSELLLLPFGYYLLFEYGVKSRGYMLGCLLLFAFCALFGRNRRGTLPLAVALALLAQVHVLFLIVAIGAVAFVALDRLSSREPATAADICALVIVGLGVAGAALSMVPPADSGFATEWFFAPNWKRSATTFRALGGMIVPTILPLNRAAAVVAALLCAVMLMRWRRSPAATLFLAISTGGILAFLYVKYPGHVWHHGLFFVILLATVWLSRLRGSGDLLPRGLFVLVLLVQASIGLRAAAIDLAGTYSNGKSVADYLRAQGWAVDPLVGVGDTAVVTVVGYLERDSAYYAEGRRFGSFVRLDAARTEPVDLAATLTDADAFGPCVNLVSARPLDADVLAAHAYREVARFDDGVTEPYVLYRRATGPCPKAP